jgi:pyruvate dehydrogenase E2 component (dihydrolipoamide acetyltransferase)
LLGIDLSTVSGSAPARRVTLRDLERQFGPKTGASVALRPAASRTPDDGILASRAVRVLAEEHGIDLTDVVGTGPAGRIRNADLAGASTTGITRSSAARPASSHPAPGPSDSEGAAPGKVATAVERGSVVALTEERRQTGDRALASLQQAAQLTTVVEVDVTDLVALAPTPDARDLPAEHVLTIRIAAEAVTALAQHPVINAYLDIVKSEVTYHSSVHLGINLAAEAFDSAVVVTSADGCSADELFSRVNGSTDNQPPATFTISCLPPPVLFASPILPPGHSASLAIGTVTRRPAVVAASSPETSIAVRDFAYLALTYDHRIVDGADASRYLSAVVSQVQRRP